MNDLMSGGLHRLWKDRLVESLSPFPGMRHLDVAGGTGDVAFRVFNAIRDAERLRDAALRINNTTSAPNDHSRAEAVFPAVGSVVVCDINESMLQEGEKKAQAKGIGKERLVVGFSSISIVNFSKHMLPINSALITQIYQLHLLLY